jgi:hypothetical protein
VVVALIELIEEDAAMVGPCKADSEIELLSLAPPGALERVG